METKRAADLVATPLCTFTLGPVALQTTCAYAMRVQVKYATTMNVRCIRAFGFFFDAFRLDAGYFGPVVLMRNFLLSFTPTIIQNDSVSPACMLSFVVAIYSASVESLQPHRPPECNGVMTTQFLLVQRWKVNSDGSLC